MSLVFPHFGSSLLLIVLHSITKKKVKDQRLVWELSGEIARNMKTLVMMAISKASENKVFLKKIMKAKRNSD